MMAIDNDTPNFSDAIRRAAGDGQALGALGETLLKAKWVVREEVAEEKTGGGYGANAGETPTSPTEAE